MNCNIFALKLVTYDTYRYTYFFMPYILILENSLYRMFCLYQTVTNCVYLYFGLEKFKY